MIQTVLVLSAALYPLSATLSYDVCASDRAHPAACSKKIKMIQAVLSAALRLCPKMCVLLITSLDAADRVACLDQDDSDCAVGGAADVHQGADVPHSAGGAQGIRGTRGGVEGRGGGLSCRLPCS